VSFINKSSQDADQLLAAIVESSDDAIISKDLNGIITSWNAAAERIFGYSAAEVLGKPITILIPAERIDEESRIIDRIARGERVDRYLTVRRTKEGRLINILLTVSPVRDRSGRVVGASKIARDLTGVGNEQLAGFMAAIVDSSDDAIVSKDLNGTITSWNKAAERVFGYTAAEAVGRPINILIPENRTDEEPEILARISRGERIDHYQTVRRRKNGQLIDISLTISPIRDSSGRIIGASKIARDISDQRRALERVRRSEERFRVTLSSIGDAVIATDVQGRITFMNPIAEKVTGWIESDALGLALDDVFVISNETTGEGVPNPVRRVLRDGATVGLANHTLLTAKDGTKIPIDDSAAPIRDLSGDLIGVVLVFRDVRIHREADLVRGRLAAIVESSDDAIVGKNLSGVVTSWNKGAQRLFGYSAGEMVGQSILRLIPSDRHHEEAEILRRLQQGNRIEHFETVRVRKDGSKVYVSLTVSPVKNSEGEVVGASKIARDIGDRVQAEQTRNRLAAIVESSDDAIISKSIEGIVESWNQGAERMFGYKASEIIGQSILKIIPLNRQQEEPAILERLSHGERVEHFETVRLRKDGREIEVSVTISPLRNSAGEIFGASKIVRDISGRKASERALAEIREKLQAYTSELEERVQERTARLEEMVGELEAFSYSISHDLRAPLRAMQQYSHVLLEDYKGKFDAQGEVYLKRIIAAGDRLDTLIRDVLAYSRVMREPLTLETVPLESLINGIIHDLPDLQPDKADVRIETPLLPVCGNPAFLTQALTNLLTNAVKFVPVDRKPTVRVWTKAHNGNVRISIQDNGIGIPTEHHSRIFGLFERLHTDREYEGTGIGLAIVRKAVERMHGTVGLQSERGAGSTFWIELKAPTA
jgi:PAS domain S-box-containing protein